MGRWNSAATNGGLRPARELGKARERFTRARLAEHPDRDYWQSVVDRIARSAFCRGANDRGWKGEFDFLIRENTGSKVLEGKYDAAPKPRTPGSVSSTVPESVRDILAAARAKH